MGNTAHEGPAQNIKRNKDIKVTEESNDSWRALREKNRRFKARGPAMKSPAAHLPTPEQKETTTSPGRSPERKVRCFKVREILQYSSPYIHPGQERPPWTGHYPKFLWRIGRLSKPEYTDYCNNLHALQKEYLRGKIELDDLQDGKQALMASITNRFFTSATHNNRSRKPLNSSSPPPIILELAQPSGPSFQT